MTRLFTPPTFVDFGPCALQTESVSPKLERVHGSRTAVLKTGIRERCPRQPGVYGMIDPHGELVYVGKAKNLRARLMTYFRLKSRDPKAGHIVAQAQSIVWEAGPDEFAALHRELELIRRWRPRLNVQGQPRSWQYYYVCLGRARPLMRFWPDGLRSRCWPALARCNPAAKRGKRCADLKKSVSVHIFQNNMNCSEN